MNNSPANQETEEASDLFGETTGKEKGFFGRNQQMITGVGIGLLSGLAIGTGAWFYERRKRMQVLEMLTLGLTAAHTALEFPDATSAIINGKSFDINAADYIIRDNAKLQAVVHDMLERAKLNAKEQEKWIHALNGLSNLSQVVFRIEREAVDERKL